MLSFELRRIVMTVSNLLRIGLLMCAPLVLAVACVNTTPAWELPGPPVGTPSTVGAGAGGGSTTGLPCALEAFLKNQCQECHSDTPGNTLPALVTFEHLTAPSQSDPSLSYAELAAVRTKNAADPMPPDGLLGDDTVAVLADWVASGSPREECGGSGGAGSGGGG